MSVHTHISYNGVITICVCSVEGRVGRAAMVWQPGWGWWRQAVRCSGEGQWDRGVIDGSSRRLVGEGWVLLRDKLGKEENFES